MKKKYYIHSRNTKNELCNKIEYLAGHYELERVYDVEEADVMISVGGDGTFLEAARLGDKPIIGVNNGTLGYLTEVEVIY